MIINGKPIHRIYISGAITGKKNFKKSFEADAVLQISDIKKSKGMQIEQAVAEKCGIPFVTLEDLK